MSETRHQAVSDRWKVLWSCAEEVLDRPVDLFAVDQYLVRLSGKDKACQVRHQFEHPVQSLLPSKSGIFESSCSMPWTLRFSLE